MADRVVLDAQTAFNLFGSSDVAGMEVTINGRTFPIAGVVQSESDFATNAALAAGNEASGDTSGSSTSTAMIYMSYSALNAMAELPIDCYEIVLPDPVSGFAKKLMTEKFPIGSGAIVQNTEMGVIGILPLIAENFQVTVPEAGWTVSIFALVVAISAPITPLLFSGINRKKVMILALGLFTLSNIISMMTTNFTVLLIFRALPAFLHPVYVSMAFTVAAASVSKEKAPKAVAKVFISVIARMEYQTTFFFNILSCVP